MLRKIGVLLICLAGVAHGRRLQNPTEQLWKSSPAESVQSLEARRVSHAHSWASARAGLKPSKALAALLRLSDAAVAFSPSGTGITGRLPAVLHRRSCFSNRAPAIGMEQSFGPKVKVAKAGSESQPIKFDGNGNLIPNLGDIVRYPGKWEGEYSVGQVDFLQAVGKEGQTVECELIPMYEVRPNLWAVPRGTKKPKIERFAISEVVKLKPPYVKEQDAYNITLRKDEEIVYRPPDPEVIAERQKDYEALKAELVRVASLLAVAGTIYGTVAFNVEIGFAYGCGAFASILYLILLETNIDTLGGGPDQDPLRALSKLRFLFPVLGFGLLIAKNYYFSGADAAPPMLFGMVLSKSQIPPLVLGFLTYKAGLLLINSRTLWDAIQGIGSTKESTSLGSIGLVRAAMKQANAKKKNPIAAAAMTSSRPLIILCGPSDDSNKRIISQLLSDSPDKFGITVACTTRPQSPSEVNGSDFTFLSDEQFDEMVDQGQFIEYSTIGDHRYGNSIAGVQSVWKTGLACVMDLDIADIPALKEKRELRTFVVWIPPTEKESSARTRMIELARQMDTFDKVLDSSESPESYLELKESIKQRLAQGTDSDGKVYYNWK